MWLIILSPSTWGVCVRDPETGRTMLLTVVDTKYDMNVILGRHLNQHD